MTFTDRTLETFDYAGNDGMVYKREHYSYGEVEWWSRRPGESPADPWREVLDTLKKAQLEEAHERFTRSHQQRAAA